MTTKTTDLWLARDPNGSYWLSDNEPEKVQYDSGDWKWATYGLVSKQSIFPDMPKGTKRRIRVTVEVLR